MLNKKSHQRQALYSLLVLAALISSYAIRQIEERRDAEIAAICSEAYANLERSTFEAVEARLKAKAAFVYDFTEKRALGTKNEEAALPLASLTKLMTVRVALSQVPIETLYTVRAEDLTSEASIGFAEGDSYSVRELARAALVSSSNNAAVMLSRSGGAHKQAFIAAMNAEAEKLGLASLKFQSVTGLDAGNETVATASGSARDIVHLLERVSADQPEIMAYSTRQTDTVRSSDGKTIALVNTDKAIPSLPVLLASKTGYTDVAGGNLAVLWRDPSGHTLGAAVLGSTEQGRFDDMIRLHDTAEIYLSTSISLSKLCK